jgi:Tfp pilus assembly protein PilF
MSLVNDYLKRLGHKSMALSDKGRGGVPPVLQRTQKGSGQAAARNKYLYFAGAAVAIYGVGYFMVSAATLSKQPVDDESVTVEARPTSVKSTAPAIIVTHGAAADGPTVQELPVQQVVAGETKKPTESPAGVAGPQRTAIVVASAVKEPQQAAGLNNTGKGIAAGKVIPAQNIIRTAKRIEKEEKTITEVNSKTDVSATEYSQPDRVVELRQPEAELSGIREEPYPLADTGQGTARATLNHVQAPVKRIFFTESTKTPDYNYQIALQAQHNNNFGRAERFYRFVLREEPGHENALVNLAAIYIQEKRLPEAQSLIDRVIAMNTENPKALVNAGMIVLQQNNEKAAADYFRQALQYNPIEETALINMAYLAQQEKKYDEAGAYYEKLVRISPEKPDILLAYAGLEEKQQKYSSAINLYRRCLDQLSMQKNPYQYQRIKKRIQVLRQYAVQQENKDSYEVK